VPAVSTAATAETKPAPRRIVPQPRQAPNIVAAPPQTPAIASRPPVGPVVAKPPIAAATTGPGTNPTDGRPVAAHAPGSVIADKRAGTRGGGSSCCSGRAVYAGGAGSNFGRSRGESSCTSG
jgi:hypothetical protein